MIISVGFVYFWKSSKILHSYVVGLINVGLMVGGGFGVAVVNRIFSSASVAKIGFQIVFFWKTIDWQRFLVRINLKTQLIEVLSGWMEDYPPVLSRFPWSINRIQLNPKCAFGQIHKWSGRMSDPKPSWSANLTQLLMQKLLFLETSNCNQMIFSSSLLHPDCYFLSLFWFV